MKTSVFFSLALAGVSHVLATPTVPEPPTLIVRQAQPVVSMRPSERAKPNVETPQGCFSSNGNMKKFQVVPSNPDIYVSTGNCITRCKEEGFKVMAVHMNDCLCGNNYPYEDDRVDDKVCNFNCFQYDQEACGGEKPAAWGVYNLGFIDVDYLEPSTSSTASAPSSTGGSRATSAPSSAETTTSSDGSNGSDDSQDEDDGGPNVVAIAAGVVGGVVLVAAVAAGFWFYLRRKRNAEIEEEHRRNAAVNAFISGSKPPSSSGLSISDSRLEPSLAHHRLSDGSIADNQDYSRKILRVINA